MPYSFGFITVISCSSYTCSLTLFLIISTQRKTESFFNYPWHSTMNYTLCPVQYRTSDNKAISILHYSTLSQYSSINWHLTKPVLNMETGVICEMMFRGQCDLDEGHKEIESRSCGRSNSFIPFLCKTVNQQLMKQHPLEDRKWWYIFFKNAHVLGTHSSYPNLNTNTHICDLVREIQDLVL